MPGATASAASLCKGTSNDTPDEIFRQRDCNTSNRTEQNQNQAACRFVHRRWPSTPCQHFHLRYSGCSPWQILGDIKNPFACRAALHLAI